MRVRLRGASLAMAGTIREQAELIDRCSPTLRGLDKKWGPRFTTLHKDMAIVREGISILLKMRPQ